MASEPQDNADLDQPDDFDSVLKAVARPPDVDAALIATITLPAELTPLSLGEPVAHEPQAGEVLDGRYQLERVLGRGGMGVVYAARNLRTGKIVAIKWMSVGRRTTFALGATTAERFRREARAAASIRHPNVVDVYDVGGPDEAPFLVMELLEGEALSARIHEGSLPFDEAARVLLGVMRGVSAAHRAGIVHRDLKPDNVFLCSQPDGGASVPKVLDFGVAAIRDDSADGLASLTRSGAIIGTPAYMSLEQLTGKAIDARADVYALGVMLFEALTGKLPFEARNAGELAVMQATGEPTRLSALRPELFGACDRLVARALSREPADRYASVDEFAVALEAVLRTPPVEVGARRSAKTRVMRRALLGVALAISGVIAYALLHEPDRRPVVRTTPRANPPAVLEIPPPPPVVAGSEVAKPATEEPAGSEPVAPAASRELTVRARRKLPLPDSAPPVAQPVSDVSAETPQTDKTRLRYDDF